MVLEAWLPHKQPVCPLGRPHHLMVIKSAAGTASTSAVGNTAGALLSCGLFAEGDQVFSGAGTLNVTYTARLTTS